MKEDRPMTAKAKRRRIIVHIIEHLIAGALMFIAFEAVLLSATFLCRWAGVL